MEREREGEKEKSSHLLVHSPNAYSDQAGLKPKSGAVNAIQFSHMESEAIT